MTYTKTDKKNLGTFMCLLLRHKPEEFGIDVDEYGYCDIDALTDAVSKKKRLNGVTKDLILEIVATCEKKRYKVNGNMIRAMYGHSYPVKNEPVEDRALPAKLFHGTNGEAMKSIWDAREGIKPMKRQYVHLSETENFATLAAKRRKDPLLLLVDTKKAKEVGVTFEFVGNEVWLSTAIPFECIDKA